MISCPKTGLEISIGKNVSAAAFTAAPVFFSRTYCPFCHVMHEWFAKDAWVCDSELLQVKPPESGDKLH